MKRLLFVLTFFLAPLQYSHAVPTPLPPLPSQLQACVDAGDCLIDSIPAVSIGSMNAYSFTDLRQGSAVTGYALSYALLPPSGEVSSNAGTTPYAGNLWLTLQDSYDLSLGSSPVTVYTDLVTPQPTNILNDTNGLDIDIMLDSSALLSGSGSEITGLDFGGIPVYQANMNLLSDLGGGSALLPCVAEGCWASAELNLIYLDFIQVGNIASLQFNPGDTRALLYELTSEFQELPENGGFSMRQSYYVSTVPVPAAVWLFGSGLVGLFGLARRRSIVCRA